MEGKVAVLGDVDFVMPFSALGLDTFVAGDTSEERIKSAEKIISDKYALVVVAENIAPMVEEVFAARMDSPTPCIVVVPFTTESKGFATTALAKTLKMATGINILQND
jgi:vacuolar-type H+-ATPase subunit F/Vma7